MEKIKYSSIQAWKRQIVQEQESRLALVPESDMSDRERRAFKGGLTQGMNDLLYTLRLQGKIEFEY